MSFLLISCKKSKNDNISHIVTEWMGKEIVYPNDVTFTLWEKDTIMGKTDYTIVNYTDTIGCISCKLQLKNWHTFITDLQEEAGDRVKVHFIFFPKDPQRIMTLLKQNKFDYPVCIDTDDSFNRLNHFPSDMMFQTFLLDRNNKVVAIGNPIHNPQVKDLYLKIIQGKEIGQGDESKKIQTEVTIDKTSFSFGKFDWKEEQKITFILKNAGNKPLVIQDVTTSCGCTTVAYSKEPVRPDRETIIEVSYKAQSPGYFNKTITVHCNAKVSPLIFKISGNADEIKKEI